MKMIKNQSSKKSPYWVVQLYINGKYKQVARYEDKLDVLKYLERHLLKIKKML